MLSDERAESPQESVSSASKSNNPSIFVERDRQK